MAKEPAPPGTPGRIGLALAGGGFMGAATHELGALCALAGDRRPRPPRLDAYVGVSAGAFIAAGLVNSVSPHRMVRMFVEDDDAETAFDPALMLRPAYREWRRALRAAPSGVSASVGAGLNEALLGPQAAFWRAVERGLRMLPNGLVDGSPAERKLAHLLTQPGRTNDFRHTRAPLRIVATDIDSGDPVEFGARGYDHIPIPGRRLPRARSPACCAGANRHRHYLDGALNKTVHASVPLEYGVGLVRASIRWCPTTQASGARRVSRSGIQHGDGADDPHGDPLAHDRRPGKYRVTHRVRTSCCSSRAATTPTPSSRTSSACRAGAGCASTRTWPPAPTCSRARPNSTRCCAGTACRSMPPCFAIPRGASFASCAPTRTHG